MFSTLQWTFKTLSTSQKSDPNNNLVFFCYGIYYLTCRTHVLKNIFVYRKKYADNLPSMFLEWMSIFIISNSIPSAIAEGDNTAQYWPNLGSQDSAIVIGPVSLFASVKCWADDGGLFRLFKFTDLQPELGPVSALYQADCHFYYGIQFWK